MSIIKRAKEQAKKQSVLSNKLSQNVKGSPSRSSLTVTLPNGVIINDVTADNVQVVAALIGACNESLVTSQGAPFDEDVYSPFSHFCTNPSCEDYQVPSSEPCDCVSI